MVQSFLRSDDSSLVMPLALNELAAALRDGELPLDVLVGRLCDRIDAVEPRIQSLLPEPGRREWMLREAERLEHNFPDPAARPPLWGVPIGVKDIFHLDGFRTQAGSALPPDVLAGAQGEAVTRALAAGALLVGKTVTTEFAFFEPGPTRNPHDPDHTPGGSSSGSAAAVAAGICALTLGTQTIGSTIRPAAYCGIVGFKPSYGRIPAGGMIPFSRSVDTVGLFTQDIAGMQLAAAVLCDGWQTISGVAKPVLGVPEGPYLDQLTSEARAAFDRQCGALTRAGFELRRVAVLPDLEDVGGRHRQLVAAEFAEVHAGWYETFASRYRPRTVALIEEGRLVGAAALDAARGGRARLRDELEHTMDRHGVDVWIAPSAPGAAPRGLHATGDPALNLPWTHAGMPALSLPAGTDAAGLPLGLQLVARRDADEQLLAWVHWLKVEGE